MKKEVSMAATKQQRELILKALTEPKFRKLLASSPAEALGVKTITAETSREIRVILATVKGIDAHIGAMADELLCACSVTAVPTVRNKA
jgi:hypothetical protein